ncbi:MAG: glycine--tRNA ligase [Candidatus Aenigmarchaeota archaeon]|nr:glycine--tRNA ligase [Candidatus Aenigmarchaeota archaeon]
MKSITDMESLAKRRGIFWQSSEIYGGLSGFYEYGHIGTLLKRKIENIWRQYFLNLDDNFFEIEPSSIMPEKVFKASGHLDNFVDPIAKCKKCGTEHRADHIMEEFLKENFEGMTAEQLTALIKKHNVKCPKCKGALGNVDVFNMTFPINLGVKSDTTAYLRPETAQGVYVNFLQQFNVTRKKLPLGLGIIGRAFRNEISPRQLIIRMREFTQAELQIFIDPSSIDKHDKWDIVKDYELILKPVKNKKAIKMTASDAVKKLKLPKFYVWYLARTQEFFLDVLGFPENKFRIRELNDEERAFYNKYHWDVEIDVESLGGFREIGGVHYRTDHDLSGHEKISKKSQHVSVDGKKFIPNVLEVSMGVDRILYSLIDIGYTEENDRSYIKLTPHLSPFMAGVFPLVKKEGMPEKAKEVYNSLRCCFDVFYDESASIGRRYARADEIGTAFCITIDGDTMKNDTVTVRERDSTDQRTVKIDELEVFLQEHL